ncbi:MAG: hypothetical protein FWF96_04645, partial [Kiritimatiellaeota bacterium]|nr:hypothetical protein [Kiritimatiellota bacterium]
RQKKGGGGMRAVARLGEWVARLRDLEPRDYAWLAFALALALLVYWHVGRLINVTASVPVALEVETEKGLAGMVEEVSVAQVTLRGSAADINALQANRLRLRLRPKGAAGQRVEVRLREHMLYGAGRLRVLDITPDAVAVAITHERNITLPVAPPMLLGQPSQGRVEISYEPKTAEVFGTGAYLDKMLLDGASLQTDFINLEDRTKSFSTNVKILMPATTAVREIKPGEVRVEVVFVYDLVSREFENVPLQLMASAGSGASWAASTNAVTVRVTGLPGMIDRLDAADIYAFTGPLAPPADVDTNTAPVLVRVPNGITIESAEAFPPTVTLRRITRRARP